MKIFFFFLTTLFLIPNSADAAGLFESCNPSICDSNLQCPGYQMFGQSLQKEQRCWPEKAYKPCGTDGDCSLKAKDNVCVVGNTVDSTSNPVAFCINSKRYPAGDKGDAILNKCLTTKNCGANEQCVRITRYDQEVLGISEFVQNNNCVPLAELPASLVLQDVTGSCGQNQQCSTDETCVENTYLDIVAKAAYVPLPGFISFKQPVCYKTTYIAGTCQKYGDQCQVSGNGAGYCMYTLDAGKNLLKCVDTTYLPGGPAAPSNYACTSDSTCKGSPGYPYCLTNPVTKKNQCFSQKNIFSDMTKLPDANCTLVGKQGCESTGKDSICAAYPDKATAVCVNYAGGGAALASGAGTATPKPSQLPDQEVTQQTYTAYAPKLQIDIPNLTFAEKITAEDGPGGIKRFSVPYLATYINAVYKYALGLGVLIAVIMLMYAGFRWMSSFGNAKAVEEAKTMVGNSVFGLFLLFSAFTILYYINPELPKLTALQILAPAQETFEVEFPAESLTPQDEQESVVGGPYAFKYFTSCPVSLSSSIEYKDSSQKKPGDIRKNIARRVEFHNAIIAKNLITGTAQEKVIKAVEATAQCKIQYENCGVATTNMYALATTNKDAKVLSCLKNDSAGHSYNGTNGFCNFLGNSFGNAKKEIIHNAWGTVSKTLRGLYCPGVKSCGSKLGWTEPCFSDKSAAATKLKQILTSSGKWSPNWINDLQPGDYYIVINWNPSCQSAHSAMFMGWKDKANLIAYVEMADAANFLRMGTKSFNSEDVVVQISRPKN